MTIAAQFRMIKPMGILTWMIVGLISGLAVNVLMKRPDRGVLTDMLLGLVGAIAGGLIATRILGISDFIDGFSPVVILVSCSGAVILVAFVEAWSSRQITA